MEDHVPVVSEFAVYVRTIKGKKKLKYIDFLNILIFLMFQFVWAVGQAVVKIARYLRLKKYHLHRVSYLL